MDEKYVRFIAHHDPSCPANTVCKIIPETEHCWYIQSNSGFVFVKAGNDKTPRIFDLTDTEYITEKEYFKGCLGG